MSLMMMAILVILSSIQASSSSSSPPPPQVAAPTASPKLINSQPTNNFNDHPSINLIPVDQPVATNQQQQRNRLASEHETVLLDHGNNIASGQIHVSQLEALDASNMELDHKPESGEEITLADSQKFAGDSEFIQPESARKPESAFEGLLASADQQQVPTVKFSPKHQQHLVERRFGLFKKGSQGAYGMPMFSANYASNPFMTDCERCLASLQSTNNLQQSSDLQLEPPIAPMPIPVSQPILPAQPPSQPAQNQFNSFGPLKSKFFMKFPFFMKPIAFGGDNYNSHETVPYWHQYQQPAQQPTQIRPQMSSALFLRPAYNCIQAAPPMLQSNSNHQDVVQLSTKTSAKQYQPHQQATYSSSSY